MWFTISHGILDEIYYPRVDQACIRDMGLIVTDGCDFFSEEKRDADSRIEWFDDGVPSFRLTNICRRGRYRIVKQVIADPSRNCVLQQVRFEPRQGAPKDYHLYVLLAPHLANSGGGNSASVGEFKGLPLLLAERHGTALALACSAPWLGRSVGFVGASDGWQDLKQHKRLTRFFDSAHDGNVALVGEIDISEEAKEGFTLALGFGHTLNEAAHRARATLLQGFQAVHDLYVKQWSEWQHSLPALDAAYPGERDLQRTSAAVLKCHESNDFPGGIVASLSIPWGYAKGDHDLGGYHLVWPRDQVECAGALLALGLGETVRDVLDYLQIVQEADGHWVQNSWLDGSVYWSGIQLGETAMPLLLLDMAGRHGALLPTDRTRFWPMVRRAAEYLLVKGPITGEDRWEQEGGYSPFTLAAMISALLVAAEWAAANDERQIANYLQQTADIWNDHIEKWIYVTDGPTAKQFAVEGHYLRLGKGHLHEPNDSPVAQGVVEAYRRDRSPILRRFIVGPDALALVRFGLRAADDPRIMNTLRVIDGLLKVNTPNGPAWHRYPDDHYGEHEDGSAYDGRGIGRIWPLLTGERAHYELAAGRVNEARRLLAAMEKFANEGGMIPEQIWDSPDIPERELFFGQASGSAMPLAWAHAEYLKLRRSLKDGKIFDMPPQTVERYLKRRTRGCHAFWRFNHRTESMEAGKSLRIELLAPATVHWGINGWKEIRDDNTSDTGLGLHMVDLSTTKLPRGTTIDFTFHWRDANRWEGSNFSLRVA